MSTHGATAALNTMPQHVCVCVCVPFIGHKAVTVSSSFLKRKEREKQSVVSAAYYEHQGLWTFIMFPPLDTI